MFEFENSEVERFYKKVNTIPVGTILTYQQFQGMGWDMHNGGRRLVYSANRVLRENDSKMLINKRGIGYVMSAGKEQMDHAWDRKRRARTQMKKAVHEVKHIDSSSLTAEQRKILTDREIYLSQQLKFLRKRNIAAQKEGIKAIKNVEKSVEIQKESMRRIDQLISEANDIRRNLSV